MPDSPPVPSPRPATPRRRIAEPATTAPRSPSEAARRAASRDADENGGNGGNGGGAVGDGAAATAKPRATRTPALQAKLEQFFAIPAMAFAAGGDTYSAEILSTRGPLVAEAWYELSKQNSTVKRMLESLVEGSAWGGVIFSSLSVVIPIAKHKGLYRGPDPFAALLGGPTPPPSSRAANNGRPQATTWSRDPSGPLPFEFPRDPAVSGDDDETLFQYQEGAPPGVVTVASGTAQHIAA